MKIVIIYNTHKSKVISIMYSFYPCY